MRLENLSLKLAVFCLMHELLCKKELIISEIF